MRAESEAVHMLMYSKGCNYRDRRVGNGKRGGRRERRRERKGRKRKDVMVWYRIFYRNVGLH